MSCCFFLLHIIIFNDEGIVRERDNIQSPRNSSGPFEFWKTAYLVEVTNLRATSLSRLLTGVTLASEWSLFFHLHQRFFIDPSSLPEYPNDFAAWTNDILGEYKVAERLANLNLVRSIDLAQVRREISIILADHLINTGVERHVPAENGFVFCQPRLVAFGSGCMARTPAEFLEKLRDIDSDSISYHLFFAPRITPGPMINDFSIWFRQWGYDALGRKLDAFDPYLNSLEDNRAYLIELIKTGLQEEEAGSYRD